MTSEAVAAAPVRVATDRYGFIISNAGTPGATTSAPDNSPALNKEAARVKKWQKMLGKLRHIQQQTYSGVASDVLHESTLCFNWHVPYSKIWLATRVEDVQLLTMCQIHS